MDVPHPKALVVDDELLIRWSVAQTLLEQGFDVTEAANGQAAVAAASHDDSYQVVVLDYRVPDANDLSLLGHLRALMPRAAIILMTAFSTPELVQRALDLGALCVLDKPFDMPELAELTAKVKNAQRE